MKLATTAAVMAAVLALSAPTQANDSTAETRAGGLVLVQNRDIDMLEEDLFVSAEQIRVRYVYRNTAPQDRTVTVAFPLPDRNLAESDLGNVAWPADFVTTVDGRRVSLEVQRRAFLGAAEHTALLTRLRVPIAPVAEWEAGPNARTLQQALDGLSPGDQQQLLRLGLAREDEWDDTGRGMERHLTPLWTVRETWVRQQTFPAGRDVAVEHRYTPGAGGSVGSALSVPSERDHPETRRLMRDHCVDRAFMQGVDRLRTREAAGNGGYLSERQVGYVLTTGGNWRAPIGRFRLVVDKGDPRNLVSFCGQGVRRISPTQFEMVRTDWRPDADLRVLIVGLPEAIFRE